MSSDLIWCVRAPTDMKSTPVSAYSRSVSSVMPPLDSGLPRQLRGEIVEHDAVHASCGEHFVDVFERTHFAFDRNVLAFCLEIGFGSFDGRADAACKVYVVVLQQNHVEQSHAVILTAADLDGHLVQYAHARGGFARVENFGMQVFDLVGIDGCLGRHAAHALHDVQQDAFGLQQGLEPSRNVEGHVARLHAVAVAEDLFELHVGVQASKHQLCDFDARENTLLFAGMQQSEVWSPSPMSSRMASSMSASTKGLYSGFIFFRFLWVKRIVSFGRAGRMSEERTVTVRLARKDYRSAPAPTKIRKIIAIFQEKY